METQSWFAAPRLARHNASPRDPAVCTMAGSENPFANADAWRRHPLLTGTWKHVAPGFFIGLAGITAYIAYDKASSKKTAKH